MNYQNETSTNVQGKWKVYVSITLSLLCAVLPFLSWLEVPMASGLYSMFGMSDDATKLSLFRYIFSGNTYQDDTLVLITTIIAVIALVGIIFNILYVVKTARHKEKSFKYGTIGSVIMLIVSVLFIISAGILTSIMQIMKMTTTPFVLLAVSIANIIFIKKVKKQNI